jgi:tRNA A-37 threonylcarbamoyl transferase component Bud32
MHVDFASINIEVQRVVADVLPHTQAILEAYERRRTVPTEARALLKFLRPLVKRAVALEVSKGLASVVRLRSCGGGRSSSSKAESDLEASCLAGRLGAKAAAKLKSLGLNDGRDGFGQVWAIDDRRAVKVQRFEVFDQRRMLQLTNEVKLQNAAAKLGAAPRVLDAFHCVCHDTGAHAAFIVQDRVRGTTLRDAQLSPPDRVAIAEELYALVSKLHAAQIHHNDLHRSNVMVHRVRGAWQVKVVDFGRASRTIHPTFWMDTRRHADFDLVEELKTPMVPSPWERTAPKTVIRALTEQVLRRLLESSAIRVAVPRS